MSTFCLFLHVVLEVHVYASLFGCGYRAGSSIEVKAPVTHFAYLVRTVWKGLPLVECCPLNFVVFLSGIPFCVVSSLEVLVCE